VTCPLHAPIIDGDRVLGVCSCATADPPEAIEAATREALRRQGCGCDATIDVARIPAGWRVMALHDRWCPRLRVAKAGCN